MIFMTLVVIFAFLNLCIVVAGIAGCFTSIVDMYHEIKLERRISPTTK